MIPPLIGRKGIRQLYGSYSNSRNIHSEFRAVYTNLQPTSAVRGAGRPQGVLVVERMMDRMAETLGLDPAAVRFHNLVPADAFP